MEQFAKQMLAREQRILNALGRGHERPDPWSPFREIDALITRLEACKAIADKMKAGEFPEGIVVAPLNTGAAMIQAGEQNEDDAADRR